MRTFILFSLTMTSFAGLTIDQHQEVKETKVHDHHEDEDNCLTEFSCKDDCSSADNCCIGNCGCPSSYLLKKPLKAITLSHIYDRKVIWIYSNYYSSQSIEPFLRPPLHS